MIPLLFLARDRPLSFNLSVVRPKQTNWVCCKVSCSEYEAADSHVFAPQCSAGQLNVPLSNHGKEQARKLAERLAAERFFKLYTSDLSRCLEVSARALLPLPTQVMYGSPSCRLRSESLPIISTPKSSLTTGSGKGLVVFLLNKGHVCMYERWSGGGGGGGGGG